MTSVVSFGDTIAISFTTDGTIIAAAQSKTLVLSKALIILIVCRLLSGVGRWGLQCDINRVYSSSLSSICVVDLVFLVVASRIALLIRLFFAEYCGCLVSIESLSYFFFCSFVVSINLMPPIITLWFHSGTLETFHWVILCPLSCTNIAHGDEIYTFTFTFLRVLPTEFNLLQLIYTKICHLIKSLVVNQSMLQLYYNSKWLLLKAIGIFSIHFTSKLLNNSWEEGERVGFFELRFEIMSPCAPQTPPLPPGATPILTSH